MINSYKELIVWQKGIELVQKVYKLTADFPKSEVYGLIFQMRRSAVAIPSNVAEGYGRKSSKEYCQFYSIAYGSVLELETQVIISKKLGFGNEKDYSSILNLIEEMSKMLHTMQLKIKKLNAKPLITKR